MGWAMWCVAPASSRCSSAPARSCIGAKRATSLILNRSSASGLPFEELGPTFVKLGQMLSTREDLLPPSWTTELALLHSQVAPVPFDELLPQVAQALGNSPFEVFREVEREPYAAASIAQVHRAKLAN